MNTIISQAMATGLPVITTHHSGLPEQVVDGHNGFLVAEGDYRELAEKIIQLIEHSELWRTFGVEGRKIVEQKYDNAKILEKQISIYNQIINED
jgi:colanic acid/amylovoran biosynthesis glycosyltransferase